MYSDIFCKVYNEFGWNYYPEAFGEQLLQWLNEQALEPRDCLDLGCGTGILCRILAEKGIDPLGVDLSPGMIAISRQTLPQLSFEVGDMTGFQAGRSFDLVTCTGDALNHLPELSLVEQAIENVYAHLRKGGYFLFDLLDEKEVSDSEPFEMEFSETVTVRFQMLRKGAAVELHVTVYEQGILALEEVIRETIHDTAAVCRLLEKAGFQVIKCGHRLPDTGENQATTWFIIAKKED